MGEPEDCTSNPSSDPIDDYVAYIDPDDNELRMIIEGQYSQTLVESDEWTRDILLDLHASLREVRDYLGDAYQYIEGIVFQPQDSNGLGGTSWDGVLYGGCTDYVDGQDIIYFSGTDSEGVPGYNGSYSDLFIHQIGHVLLNRAARAVGVDSDEFADNLYVEYDLQPGGDDLSDAGWGFKGSSWRVATVNVDLSDEEFADMFLGNVTGKVADGPRIPLLCGGSCRNTGYQARYNLMEWFIGGLDGRF